MRSFLSLPRRAPPASTLPLTCSPWVARGGWAPRPVVVVVGVIFLTKPPLRPLLPDTHDASSFRSSPAWEAQLLSSRTTPTLPGISDFKCLWSKEAEAPRECLRREQHIRVLGLQDACWVLMKGRAKERGPWAAEGQCPHQYRGSRYRAGADPPQACHPGGENGAESGRPVSLPSHYARNGTGGEDSYSRNSQPACLLCFCHPHGSGRTPTLTNP